MKIRLNFNISPNALPALLTVRDFRGRLVFYEKIYFPRNRLCFCTRAKNLIISVSPYNAAYHEKSYYIKLEECGCTCFRLNFDVEERDVSSEQNFYLVDYNYGFPVLSAILRFLSG